MISRLASSVSSHGLFSCALGKRLYQSMSIQRRETKILNEEK